MPGGLASEHLLGLGTMRFLLDEPDAPAREAIRPRSRSVHGVCANVVQW